MARITKQPEERRQELVDAAGTLFMTQGYGNTSVSDIVQHVGVAQGLFYYYFHSKQDIMLAVAEQFIQANMDKWAEKLSDDRLSAPQRIQTLISILPQFLRQLESLNMGSHPSPAVFALISDKVQDVLEPLLVELLRQGTEQGLLDAPDPTRMARFLIAGFIALEGGPNPPAADEMIGLIQLVGRRLLLVPDEVLDQLSAEG